MRIIHKESWNSGIFKLSLSLCVFAADNGDLFHHPAQVAQFVPVLHQSGVLRLGRTAVGAADGVQHHLQLHRRLFGG